VGFGSTWAANRALIIAMVLLLIAYLIITVTVPMFRTIGNLIAFLVLEAILVFAFKVSGVFVHGRSAFIGPPRHRLRRSDACGPIGGTRPFDSVCDWHCKYRPSLSDRPWRAVLVGLRRGHYHRRLDWLPEWGPVLQAAGPGADRYTRDRFCRGRPSSNCHQYRLSVQRQRFRDGAVLALQSCSHEGQHVRIEGAPDISAVLLVCTR